jgi:ribosomal protein S18 acetylase RimI-like enzyme
MKCHYDNQDAYYRCTRTGEYLCLEHARFDVVSVATRVKLPPLPVRAARPEDRGTIEDVAMMYWGETQVECFERTYNVLRLPALLAMSDDQVAGVLSYALEADEGRLNIVMLSVHPEYQGRHAARCLLAKAEEEARAQHLSRLVVATSNDDLPALYTYQRWGFIITEVKAGAIVEHHGGEEPGFASIPVRDEIRMETRLREA